MRSVGEVVELVCDGQFLRCGGVLRVLSALCTASARMRRRQLGVSGRLCCRKVPQPLRSSGRFTAAGQGDEPLAGAWVLGSRESCQSRTTAGPRDRDLQLSSLVLSLPPTCQVGILVGITTLPVTEIILNHQPSRTESTVLTSERLGLGV